jgi:phage terminase large subunit-like protein
MSRQDLLKLHRTVKELNRREQRNRIATYFDTPEVRALYPKQMEFYRLSATHNEVALFGGNRSGKTVAGGCQDVWHLTGTYPDWYPGKRFTTPVDGWSAGTTAKKVRDITQALLCGTPGNEAAKGTGLIPGDLILRTTIKHGIADAYESVFVRHVPTGGVSTLQFKSYDQGREAFEGTSQHFIHLDEEPPEDVYTECLLRIMTVNGLLTVTATPLLGLTALMLQFLPELQPTPQPEAN